MDVRRDRHLKEHYGIGIADLNRMLDDQGGVCAICSTDEWGGRWNYPCVDHDHSTNVVRGLLCLMCNRGIGNFEDDRELLLAAHVYLGRVR